MLNELMTSLNTLVEYMGWNIELFNDSIYELEFQSNYSSEENNICFFDFSQIYTNFGDAFCITINNQDSLGNPIYIEKSNTTSDLDESLKDLFDIGELLNIKLQIDKKKLISHIFPEDDELFKSFVFLKSKNIIHSLYKYKDFKMLEENIFEFGKKTIFYVIDEEIFLSNKFIAIAGSKDLNELLTFKTEKICSVASKISLKNDNCNWHYNSPSFLVPDYFYFNNIFQVNNEIINYFNRLTADLCIQFLSNLTISDNCDTLTSTIYGQKKLIIKYYDLRKYDCNNIDYLYKIYSWVYLDNNPDKISIFRNLSTIYLNEEEDFYGALINKSQSIYDSVLRNFSIYLRSNIEQYFAARESFINFIDSRANKVMEEIQTITRDMSKTVLTSLAFIFASIFGQKEYSAAIRYLPLFFIVYIIANIFFTHVFSFKNLRNIDSDYTKKTKEYKELLFDEHYAKETESETSIISKSKRRFYIYWGISLVIHLLLIVISLYIFFNFNEIIAPMFEDSPQPSIYIKLV